MIHITPPTKLIKTLHKKIFLAGSIEMGKAEEWQDKAAALIKKYENENCVVFNPRREDYDVTQEQSLNNPYFTGQVNWELDALEMSNQIIFYFDPNTISAISLLELGRFSNTHDLRVFCPDGYFRKGNVDIFCGRYGVKMYDSLESTVKSIFI